jgi:hypothetical protein
MAGTSGCAFQFELNGPQLWKQGNLQGIIFEAGASSANAHAIAKSFQVVTLEFPSGPEQGNRSLRNRE